MADLSVIIVNYNSGWFCANLVDSLNDQRFLRPDGKPGSLQIIVVDNDSPTDQSDFLTALEARGVEVVRSRDNTGYGGGNNLGMERVTSDWVLISNPDIVMLPGSLQKMLDLLFTDSRIGMVGPRGYLDPGLHFFLPPMERKTVYHHLYESAGRVFKALGRRFSLRRARHALGHWAGAGHRDVEGIAGYCFLMPADLARDLGPFDPEFPFYYEDDDLSVRVLQAGRRLVYARDTRVIHFYNKSAGPVFDEVMEKYYRSKSYYFRKHQGRLGHWLYRTSIRLLRRYRDRLSGTDFLKPIELGRLSDPPVLDLPDGQGAVLELTLDPAFVMAVGHLHPGGEYRMPRETWDALDATIYYLRVLDGDARGIRRLYRFEKTAHPVATPAYLDLKERWS